MGKDRTKQGVRDLNQWKPAKKEPTFQSEYNQAPPLPDIEVLSDLIYDDTKRIRDEVSGRFPEAIFEGEYDEIHGERLSVRGIKASRLTYYKFLVTHGLSDISLLFQMAIYQDQKTVEAALDDVSPLWRERAKKRAQREHQAEE
jgi:hypothetical protein